MSSPESLLSALNLKVAGYSKEVMLAHGEITLEVEKQELRALCKVLKDEPMLSFEQLMDISGIDYQAYGCAEWMTEAATHRGFDRGVNPETDSKSSTWQKPHFAAVYHLLSLTHNHRLRLRTFAETIRSNETQTFSIDSVTDIWASANWYEREVFDLYGIQFTGHPNLERLLTDYGFEGHPFRKDFPLIGRTEVRYDEKAAKVIHEPVTSVTPRTVIPKVLRTPQDLLNQNDPR